AGALKGYTLKRKHRLFDDVLVHCYLLEEFHSLHQVCLRKLSEHGLRPQAFKSTSLRAGRHIRHAPDNLCGWRSRSPEAIPKTADVRTALFVPRRNTEYRPVERGTPPAPKIAAALRR